MLRSTNDLSGYSIHGTDGDIGHLRTLLFDDRNLKVRYFVVDTGHWLPGRKVLLYPSVVGKPDWDRRRLPVDLTREQVENSPGIDEDAPVSRQHQSDLHTYYGWPLYWSQGIYPAVAVPYINTHDDDEIDVDLEEDDGDPHLRSAAEVTGYTIRATDGDIGHVEDFILDVEHDVIRYLVVDTRNWLPGGRKVLVSPQWIDKIDWAGVQVWIDLTCESIRESPEFDVSAPVNREYEARLYDYYGRPAYWQGVPGELVR